MCVCVWFTFTFRELFCVWWLRSGYVSRIFNFTSFLVFVFNFLSYTSSKLMPWENFIYLNLIIFSSSFSLNYFLHSPFSCVCDEHFFPHVFSVSLLHFFFANHCDFNLFIMSNPYKFSLFFFFVVLMANAQRSIHLIAHKALKEFFMGNSLVFLGNLEINFRARWDECGRRRELAGESDGQAGRGGLNQLSICAILHHHI